MNKPWPAALAVLGLLIALRSYCGAGSAATGLMESAQQAVVRVRVWKGSDAPADVPGTVRSKFSLGTGFIVARGGYVLTALHTLGSERPPVGDPYQVMLPSEPGRYFGATVIGQNPDLDLAVLRIARDVKSVIQASPKGPAQGQLVWAVGFPNLDAAPTLPLMLSRGDVLAISADLPGSEKVPSRKNLVRCSNVAAPGFSGGPLLDQDGRWVGVTIGILEKDGQWYGSSYARNSREAMNWVAEVLNNDGPRRSR